MFKIGNAVLCEYVTESRDNQHTLVNVMSGNIGVAGFPCDLSVSVYFEIMIKGPAELPPTRVEVEVDGVVVGVMPLEGAQIGPYSTAVVGVVPHGTFKFGEPGQFGFYLTSDGYERTLILSREIRQDE